MNVSNNIDVHFQFPQVVVFLFILSFLSIEKYIFRLFSLFKIKHNTWKKKGIEKAIRKTDRTQCFLIHMQNPEAFLSGLFFCMETC
ncbi:hypothetical protein BSM4216_1129 [Bacillus smithii]|nr:hypothetical protein BSM4216_1129 [Bacillus smithii]